MAAILWGGINLSTYTPMRRGRGISTYLPGVPSTNLPEELASYPPRGEEAVRTNCGCAVAWPSQGHMIYTHREIKNLNILIRCNEMIVLSYPIDQIICLVSIPYLAMFIVYTC